MTEPALDHPAAPGVSPEAQGDGERAEPAPCAELEDMLIGSSAFRRSSITTSLCDGEVMALVVTRGASSGSGGESFRGSKCPASDGGWPLRVRT
jgi:hypothetical protein